MTITVNSSPVLTASSGRSTGVSEAGWEADAVALRLAAESGLDLSAHRSSTVSDALLAGADLVLAMTTAILRHVVVVRREAWPRTFTLRELVARAAAAPPDGALDAPVAYYRLPGPAGHKSRYEDPAIEKLAAIAKEAKHKDATYVFTNVDMFADAKRFKKAMKLP